MWLGGLKEREKCETEEEKKGERRRRRREGRRVAPSVRATG